MSLTMSLLFVALSVFLMVFSFLVLYFKREVIAHEPDKLPNYSALFEEVNNKNPIATYYYFVFFVRRLLFACGLVLFYQGAASQMAVCIFTSFFVAAYLVAAVPYKAKVLNRFTIFNEL